jgi:hypothetical protein
MLRDNFSLDERAHRHVHTSVFSLVTPSFRKSVLMCYLHMHADLQTADITKACSAIGGEPHIPRRLEEARKVPEAHNEAFAAGTFSARHSIAVQQEHFRDLLQHSRRHFCTAGERDRPMVMQNAYLFAVESEHELLFVCDVWLCNCTGMRAELWCYLCNCCRG